MRSNKPTVEYSYELLGGKTWKVTKITKEVFILNMESGEPNITNPL